MAVGVDPEVWQCQRHSHAYRPQFATWNALDMHQEAAETRNSHPARADWSHHQHCLQLSLVNRCPVKKGAAPCPEARHAALVRFLAEAQSCLIKEASGPKGFGSCQL